MTFQCYSGFFFSFYTHKNTFSGKYLQRFDFFFSFFFFLMLAWNISLQQAQSQKNQYLYQSSETSTGLIAPTWAGKIPLPYMFIVHGISAHICIVRNNNSCFISTHFCFLSVLLLNTAAVIWVLGLKRPANHLVSIESQKGLWKAEVQKTRLAV